MPYSFLSLSLFPCQCQRQTNLLGSERGAGAGLAKPEFSFSVLWMFCRPMMIVSFFIFRFVLVFWLFSFLFFGLDGILTFDVFIHCFGRFVSFGRLISFGRFISFGRVYSLICTVWLCGENIGFEMVSFSPMRDR